MNRKQSWYILQTRPRAELSVRRILEYKGYSTFFPLYKSRRRWSDRVVDIEMPLFPTYIFFSYEDTAVGRAVTTPGVVRILGVNGAPSPVLPEEIDSLQKLAQSDVVREPWKFLPVGTMVRVETGPLKGIQGTLVAVENARSLLLSVTLLQRSVAVKMDSGMEVSVIDPRPEGRQAGKASMAMGLLRR